MDVSISGVKGYEFQYDITILLSLVLMKGNGDLKIFVEPLKGEDFSIHLENNGKIKKFEVQVKSEKTDLTTNKLLEWLCHFEAHTSDKCLFSKIIDDETGALIVTKSRCTSEISFLLKEFDENIFSDKKSIYKKEKHKHFCELLQKASFYKPTKLGKKRNEYCKGLSDKIKDKTSFENAFRKVIILESISELKIESEIKLLLNLSHKIPHSKTKTVLLQLQKAVRESRDDKTDFIIKLKKVINIYRTNKPKLNEFYFARGFEENLITEIEQKNVLLLTGSSLCGKTEIAKKITNHYIDLGYNYSIVSEFLNAEEFLFNNYQEEDKVIILEDPFGHLNISENAIKNKNKLSNLIKNLHSNHKLIITSRKEITDELFKKTSLGNSLFDWKDLTITDQKTSIQFWKDLSQYRQIDDKIVSKIESTIKLNDKENTLQIGQIEFLSRLDRDEILSKKLNELETIARSNSDDIALEIINKKSEIASLLSVLSFCGNTIYPIPLKDLGYIISIENQDNYSIHNSRLESLKQKKTFDFIYNKKYKISVFEDKKIDYLEEKGYINRDNKKIIFTHPNYYEAGRYVFVRLKKKNQKLFLINYFNAITCYNEQIAFFSSKQLDFLYKNSSHIDVKKEIIKIAFKSLLSIFPSVIDNVTIFLTSIIEELNSNKKARVIHLIENSSISTYNLEWLNDETPIEKQNPLVGFNRKSNLTISNKEVLEIEELFLESKHVSSEKIWRLIYHYDINKKSISEIIFEKLLLSKYSFIREKISYLFFKYSINNNNLNKIIEEAFNDEHPSVVFKCIKGSLESWTKLSDGNKKLIKPLLEKALSRKDICIRASNLMNTFSIDYASDSINWRELNGPEKEELWGLWSKLYLIYSRNSPISVSMHTPRFVSTMDEAIKHIKIRDYVKILECWYSNIISKLEQKIYLDDHEISIAKNLLDSTKGNFKIRKKLFENLITTKDTSLLLSSLKWFISDWKVLNRNEKQRIVELLSLNRKDTNWIKAVILTSNEIPIELIEVIFKDKHFFEKELDYILHNFDEQLLDNCLSVYFGHPQPLWSLALQHRNHNIWNEIVDRILETKHKIGYKKCITNFLFEGVNGFIDQPNKKFKLWEKICKTSDNKSIEINQLIYATASCTCNITSAKKLWKIIIDEFQNNSNEKEIINIIKDNIIILQYHERDEIIKIFGRDILLKILKVSFPDSLIFMSLSQNPKEEELEIIINKIEEIVKTSPIKLYITFNYIENFLIKSDIGDKLKEQMYKLPNSIYSSGKKLMKKLDQDYYTKIENWISLIDE